MNTISVTCHKCNGEGIWTKDTLAGTVDHDPCPVCAGKKYLSTSIITMPVNVFEAYLIYEAIVPNEYTSMNDAQKLR